MYAGRVCWVVLSPGPGICVFNWAVGWFVSVGVGCVRVRGGEKEGGRRVAGRGWVGG